MLVDIWVLFAFCLLQTMVLWVSACKSLYAHVFIPFEQIHSSGIVEPRLSSLIPWRQEHHLEVFSIGLVVGLWIGSSSTPATQWVRQLIKRYLGHNFMFCEPLFGFCAHYISCYTHLERVIFISILCKASKQS